eukprot:TRINITY_DN23233_c0_g1_i1.p1 TRINITY_DN23233_c0_g1~~TRINITY_DN23233_c0_g1_i1.p1  ORF type:complete len:471 (+),score=132.43 TRINITY_DN23233_c0_g1_i1:80-1492(+)
MATVEFAAPQGRLEAPAEDAAEDGGDRILENIGVIVSSLQRCTQVAVDCRERQQTTRAVKQMERTVALCKNYERAHPRLTLESARARLNLGAMLSSGGRRREALAAIKDAQLDIAKLLEWAQSCEAEDPGAAALAVEARALQCAALVAEGIEAEHAVACSGGALAGDAADDAESEEAAEEAARARLYGEADAFARNNLPASHPVASLASRLLRQPTGVTSPKSGRQQATSFGGTSLPSVCIASANYGASGAAASCPSGAGAGAGHGAGAGGLQLPADSMAREVSGPEPSAVLPSGAASTASPSRSRKASKERGKAEGGSGRRPARPVFAPGEPRDIFKQYLRDVQAEKDARRSAFFDVQGDARRRLMRIHKASKFDLMNESDDLKDKRFTTNGHKVMMESMTKGNVCRSDPALLKDAKKTGDTPEVVQMKKLYKSLYKKPPTPPPPPPQPKPKLVDDSLAGLLRKPAAEA